MTSLIPVPWCINGVAFLECGHAALVDGDLVWCLAKQLITSWYSTCPQTGDNQRIISLIVRQP